MEIVAEKLKAMITCAENSLDNIIIELETEVTKQAGTQLNPISLLSAIEDAKKELAKLKSETEELEKAQTEAKERLTEKVQVLCEKLEDLEKKMGSTNSLSSNAGSVMKSHLKM